MSIDRHMAFGGLGLLAVLAIGASLFVWPNYREAAAIYQRIAALQTKIADLQGRSQMVQELRTQVDLAQEHQRRDLKAIPQTAELASLIRALSQDVDRISVVDQTFTAGSPGEAIVSAGRREGGSGGAPLQAMPLTVDMNATFDSIFALIRNAESFDRLVRVVSVHLLCKREDSQKPLSSTTSATPILKASVGLEAIFGTALPGGGP